MHPNVRQENFCSVSSKKSFIEDLDVCQICLGAPLCMSKYAGVLGYEVLTKNVCVCHLGQIWPGVQGNKTSALFVQKNLD